MLHISVCLCISLSLSLSLHLIVKMCILVSCNKFAKKKIHIQWLFEFLDILFKGLNCFWDILPQACNMVMNSSEEVVDGDEDLIDIDSFLDDDTFMSFTFE